MIIAGINYKWQVDCHTGLSIVFLTKLSPRLIRNWNSVNSRAVLFSSDRHLQIISFGEVQKLCSKPLAILEQRIIWEAVSYHFPPLETSQGGEQWEVDAFEGYGTKSGLNEYIVLVNLPAKSIGWHFCSLYAWRTGNFVLTHGQGLGATQATNLNL